MITQSVNSYQPAKGTLTFLNFSSNCRSWRHWSRRRSWLCQNFENDLDTSDRSASSLHMQTSTDVQTDRQRDKKTCKLWERLWLDSSTSNLHTETNRQTYRDTYTPCYIKS